jgi:hypothetical protein
LGEVAVVMEGIESRLLLRVDPEAYEIKIRLADIG